MKHLVRIIIWTALAVYLFSFVLPRIPAVQTMLAATVSNAIANKLGTKVKVGRIDLRLLNRIIIDDMSVYDQQNSLMLRAGRVSATVELLPILDGRISISSAQMFGMRANIYRRDSKSPLNCQFAIDSLASKDTADTTPLNLSIASLIIRNGNITYNQWDKPQVKGQFSPYHINVSQLSSHIILYRLTDDSVNVSLKRLGLKEASGIILRNLTADVKGTSGDIKIKDARLDMPHTSVNIPAIKVSYAMKDSVIRDGSLQFAGQIRSEKLSLSDFAPLLPGSDISAIPTLKLAATAEGTDKSASATLFAYTTEDADLSIQASATATNLLNNPDVDILFSKCHITESLVGTMARILNLPETIKHIGAIDTKGRLHMNGDRHLSVNADISASKVGKVSVNGEYNAGKIRSAIKTSVLDLTPLFPKQQLSSLKCELNLMAGIDKQWNITSGTAKGTVSELTYRNYTYRNINTDMTYTGQTVSGFLGIQDPNIRLSLDGKADLGKHKGLHAKVSLSDFCPSALNLTRQLAGDRIAVSLNADASGSSIDDISGSISLTDISITNHNSDKADAYLEEIRMEVGHTEDGKKTINLNSDFANAYLHGDFTASTIVKSFTNLITTHLPAATFLPAPSVNSNDFRFDVTVHDLNFVKRLVALPLTINSPLNVGGYVNSTTGCADISLSAPDLNISGTILKGTDIKVWTETDAIYSTINTYLKDNNGQVAISLDCKGEDNTLCTKLSWDNQRVNIFRGTLNSVAHFNVGTNRASNIQVSIPHSTFAVGDTLWNIRSHGINYQNGSLTINHLAIENDNQHLYVSGTASPSPNDTISAELKDINVRYILDLVNFHSVDFDGLASGSAVCTGVMQKPNAMATLTIKDFKFEGGNLGTMSLNADYNGDEGQINVDGTAVRDTTELLVNGNISPIRNSIDLNMTLHDTYLDFMQSFCGSFLNDIALQGTGHLRLHGPLNAINLEGEVKPQGAFTLTSTGCRYTMENGTISFIPNDILFNSIPIKDKMGGVAYLEGGVHHRNLGRISYDITAKTKRLIAYDSPIPEAEDNFCGYAIIDGEIGVHGKGNEVNITADCTPLAGTYFTYNVSSPEAIMSQDFITWGSADKTTTHNGNSEKTDSISKATNTEHLLNAGNDRANIRLNFMLNVTPTARLHLIMDETTGDYVDLFGNGTLRVQYYNKGSLGIFGNYAIDHGTYKMTIQNLMRRDFAFQKGSTIAFAGDPYNAILNLQAAYTLNSVSLADLNIGSSFTSNNVPVNCLMNISGTPEKPKVEFGLNLPSLSSDARQMVYSVINSEEEMNQQVLYLLAIGRFYSQTNDEENTQRTKQSTLAMQSFLSGTLSQQLNNVLGQVTGNTNWSFGANITPGTDGFNNAVYEGLLSGRMFNNRLIFNGQFGYRDNINTDTQNFIGDFTLQYLLTPNGNFALKMYNQSNDRYFTRSSLNTQGIGIVIQKEFGK